MCTYNICVLIFVYFSFICLEQLFVIMCNSTFITTLKHILNLLLELVRTVMQISASSSIFNYLNYSYSSTNIKRKSKLFCTFCRKEGHTRRRCYHVIRACFECVSSEHFVRNCPLRTTLSEITTPLSLNNDSNLINGGPRMSTLERHARKSASRSNLTSLRLGSQIPVIESLCNFSEVKL